MKRNRKDKKQLSRPQLIIRILMVFCLLAIGVSGTLLVKQLREYQEGNSAYESLRSVARPIKKPLEPPSVGTQPEHSEEEQAFVSVIDFEALREVNRDTVGWLYSEGTVIDYPVVQGTDNAFYLNHLFTGEYNKLGTLFLDYRNQGLDDRLSVIYGHNMRDKSMLTGISYYKDQAYYDRYPDMTLYLPDRTLRVRLFAGVTVSGASDTLRLSFADDDEFLRYIGDLQGRSTFRSPIEVTASDRVLALVTCTYSFENARYLLFGIMEPVRE